jgi:peptide/nickel transport system permease protein
MTTPILRSQSPEIADTFRIVSPERASAAASARDGVGPSPWRLAWRTFRRNRPAVIGLAIIVLSILASVLAPVVSPHDPVQSNPAGRLAPPGTPGRVLGADHLGRDVLSRVLYGGRVSLVMGLAPVTAAGLLALVLGLVAGYFEGSAGTVIMRTLDVSFAFPSIFLAIAITGALGPGLVNVLIALTIVLVPPIARVARTSVMEVKHHDYIEAARASGARDARIIRLYVLPNVLAPVIVYCTLLVALVVVIASGLSFLGLGVQPPTPDWGRMIAEGREVLVVAPHVAAFPGLMLLLFSLAFNFLGDGLRDALDPRLRGWNDSRAS